MPFSWRFCLFGLFLSYDKYYRCFHDNWFLLSCRKKNIIPNFITHTICTNHISSERSVKLEESFKRKLLNDVIRSKFKALNRLTRDIQQKNSSLRESVEEYDHQTILDTFLPQLETYHVAFKRSTQEKKLKKLVLSAEKKSTDSKLVEVKVKDDRVHYIGVEKDDETFPILAKGPNFALTRKIDKKCLKEVEVNYERFIYGYRWKIHSTKKDSQPLMPILEDNEEVEEEVEEEEVVEVEEEEEVQPKRLYIPTPNAWKAQPWKLSHDEEHQIKTVKSIVMKSYQNHKVKSPNVPRKVEKKLEDMSKDRSIVVKRSDKDKKFVVASREMYVNCTKKDLSNTKVYAEVKKDPVHNMIKDCKRVTDVILRDNPDQEKLSSLLTPHLPSTPHYYSLWKTHKEGYDIPPRRPVVAKIGNPLQNVSLLVSHILGQVMIRVPTNIKSSDEFIAKRRKRVIKVGRILMSSDISALYTNIPLEQSRKAIIKYISGFYHELDNQGISLEELDGMMEVLFNNGYFCFDDKFYMQFFGLPMGDNPAPATATIFVYLVIEKPILEHDFSYVSDEIRERFENDPKFLALTEKIEDWERYLDDTYTEFDGNEEEGQQLMEIVNVLHESIKFPETQMGNSIVFLDFTISINDVTRDLEFELYIKPTNVGIFLSYVSAHPRSILLSVAENELRRAIRRSNTDEGAKRGLKKISNLLRENDYPEKIIEKSRHKVEQKADEIVEKVENDFIGNKNILKLYYIDEQHKRKLLKELKNNSLIEDHTRVIFIPGPKLTDKLIRSKLNPQKCNSRPNKCYVCLSQENATQCMVKDFVYSLKCNLCEAEYVGESGRRFKDRMAEHFRSVTKCDTTGAMGAHYLKHHPNENIPDLPFTCKLIRKCEDFVNRKAWQSKEIEVRQPSVNVQLMATKKHNLPWNF